MDHALIAAALKRGPVYSNAAGRVGQILHVADDGWVHVKVRNQECVTHFDRGDAVVLVERDGRQVVQNA